jgi:molybdopterin molybdotransferase
LGLPGNPVSAFTTMQLFALPFLLALQGDEQLLAAVNAVKKRYPVCLAKAMTPTRENFLRVALVECEGQWQLQPFSHQGSGVLSSVVHSSGFARIAKDQQTAPMALVEYWPFVFDGVF